MAKQRTARDIMKAPVISVKEDMLVADVIKLLTRSHISGVPVVDDDGKLIAMVTNRLIMHFAVSGNTVRTRVADVMSKQLEIYGPTYSLDTPIGELVEHFASSRINRVLIVEDDRVVGIISRSDIIGELERIYLSLS
jgi:CBS domain-containing protein